MTPQEKDKLDMQARLHQMKINTRLTALQSALTLMGTAGYIGIPGQTEEGKPTWVKQPGAVDMVTLLAISAEIEGYIIGDLEQETKDAMEIAGKQPSKILQVRP